MPSTINNNDLFLVVRGGANYKVTAADVAAYTGGGGGGGVTSIAVTAPINDTGTATVPNIGIDPATTTTAGSLSAADKVKIDALPATIVAAVTGTAPIVIAGTASNPDVTISAATTGAPGSVELADSTEAAAGTDATRAMTPATSVPKTPADMTGAALLPGGGDGGRPLTPAIGMLRYNNQGGIPGVLEFYDGSGWVTVSTGGGALNSVITGVVSVGGAAGTTTVTHASVDPLKSFVVLNAFTSSGGVLVNSTYVFNRTATSFDIIWSGNNLTGSWQLVS